MKLMPARYGLCCGVDEAGRGALAGPVVAAAVILPRGWYPEGLDDSKKLSRLKRLNLFKVMMERVKFGIGVASPNEVDSINVQMASLLAMKRSILNLTPLPNSALIDGIYVPKKMKIYSRAIVAGDSLVPAIAAASIFAKVYRDDFMNYLSKVHPFYGWDKNAGYGTKHHLMALKTL